jgi:hypothetical protein
MQSYKDHFVDKGYRVSFFSGFVLLFVSLVVQFLASGYATRSVSGSVTDVILSNTRVYDVDGIFIYGTVIFFLFVVFVCLTHPKSFPFVLKSVAVFTLIRSVFISLTHINIYPLHAAISSVFFQGTIFRGIFTGDGLFFSGHTGLPFLLALIFWNHKRLRFIFICSSVSFALIVLLGHLHYSIDVLSAFFITYSIFHINKFIFKEDWQLFSQN